MTGLLDQGAAVILMSFDLGCSEAFNTVLLMKNGLKKWTVGWIENWLNCWSPLVVISSAGWQSLVVCPRGQYWVQSCFWLELQALERYSPRKPKMKGEFCRDYSELVHQGVWGVLWCLWYLQHYVVVYGLHFVFLTLSAFWNVQYYT